MHHSNIVFHLLRQIFQLHTIWDVVGFVLQEKYQLCHCLPKSHAMSMSTNIMYIAKPVKIWKYFLVSSHTVSLIPSHVCPILWNAYPFKLTHKVWNNISRVIVVSFPDLRLAFHRHVYCEYSPTKSGKVRCRVVADWFDKIL